MHPIKKAYYHLTAYIPRRLPTTEKTFLHFTKVLFEAYDVPNEPSSWAMIAGCVKSQKGHKLRIPWGNVANAAKRLKINALANCYQVAAMQENMAKIEKLANEEIARDEADKAKTSLENLNGPPLA